MSACKFLFFPGANTGCRHIKDWSDGGADGSISTDAVKKINENERG